MIQQIFTGLGATPEEVLAGCGCGCGTKSQDYSAGYNDGIKGS